MSTPLLRPVAPRCGAPTWIARRTKGEGLGRLCLAHRLSDAAAADLAKLRGLDHRHVARTLGVARIDGHAHALTALRPSESMTRLRDRLARAGRPGLPVPVVVRAVIEVADGLAALHARGVRHGAVDARRVAIEYGGRAILRDTAVAMHRGATAEDDIVALGRLVRTVCVDLPAPLADLVERIEKGTFERAADVAAALHAWSTADPATAAVDDAQVTRWIRRVCAARFDVWNAVVGDEAITSRTIDALAVLLGAPRAVPTLGR